MNMHTGIYKILRNFFVHDWAMILFFIGLVSPATFAQHDVESSVQHGDVDHICQPIIPESSLFEFSRSGLSDCGDRNVIDILWVYTPAALERIGSESLIEVLCQVNVDDANTTFANSQLPFSVRTVGLIQTEYDESGDHLALLQGQTDGVMDEVHGVRDSVAADIVVLINDAGFCGVAYLAPDNEAFGFQKVTASCFATTNAFRHEIGHNLGSRHFVDDPGGFFPYSTGHVLSFNDGSSVGTAMGGNAIPHFSNPRVEYEGVATGVAVDQNYSADNWLAFMQTAPLVADFRCSGDCNGNGLDDGLEILSGTVEDCDGNGIPDECQVDLNSNGIIDACEALPVIVRVPEDVTSIQLAVSMAESGVHEIVVGPGVWSGAIDTFGKAITIRSSDGPRSTTLDGLERGPVIRIRRGETASTVIDGFSIVKGHTRSDGGGILIENSSPVIKNCIFYQCRAEYAGGAIRISNGSPKIVDCEFSQNLATFGGAVSAWSGSPEFLRCIFRDNFSFDFNGDGNEAGGAVSSWTSNPSFVDCYFADNESGESGGAIFIVDGGGANAPYIEGTQFLNNFPDHINQGQWIDGGGNEFLYELPCNADFTDDGELDFFDIAEFLTAYSFNYQIADFNLDGQIDFFDISSFLTAYAKGCP